MSASERDPAIAETLGYNGFFRGESVMVKQESAACDTVLLGLLPSRPPRLCHTASVERLWRNGMFSAMSSFGMRRLTSYLPCSTRLM
jgi:hypothetical protein